MGTVENISTNRASQARIAQILMGIIFLLAGLPKTWDPVLFYWDVVPYTILLGLDESASAMVSKLALALGPIECIVGLAMLVNWRRPVIYPIAVGLMVVFTALVGLAWANGYDGSCGCFGSLLERSAQGAFVEDVMMLGLLGFGWYAGSGTKGSAQSGRWVGIGAVFCVVLSSTALVQAGNRIGASDLQPGVPLRGLSLEEAALNEGERLIVVLTPTCARCRRAIPRLNALVEDERVPPIVGLTPYEQVSDALVELKASLDPSFPIYTIDKNDFMRLAWGNGVPRIALLQDGVISRVWEAHALPDADEIHTARN